jgi:tRNA pseudouridine38-40 synthase
MRYKLELCYRGTNYHGWQRQPNAVTVQQVLEDAINLLYSDNIAITGCGRTDTGVHAKYYVAHFDSDNKYDSTSLVKLNRYIPHDISLISICETNQEFHARFSALSRSYEYVITTVKDPFLNGLAWFLPYPLRVDLMELAIEKLFDYTDFTSFSKLHTDVKTNNCKIMEAGIRQQKGQIIFYITADRFLRNMVRAITGTLVEVGREKISVDEFCKIIEAANRGDAGQSVPADGLFLMDVKY